MSENELENVFETSDSEQVEATQPEPPAEKGEPNAEPPTAEKEPANEPVENAQVPREALIAERHKRQSSESRIKELEEELAKVKAPKPEELKAEKQRIDLFAEPEKFQDSVEQRIAMAERKALINTSRLVHLKMNPDYVEKESKFLEMVKVNPSLAIQMNESDDPAGFAYETAKKQMAIDEIATDPAAYEAKLREKLRQEWEAETQTKTPEKPSKKLPPSLATANGVKESDVKLDSLQELFAD
jgi:hypothetical protein